MHVVAMVSAKGGAGKSTLACHLAVAALRAGEKVALLDTDPQGSAIAWASERSEDSPTVAAIDSHELDAALAEAQVDGYSLVLVDTEGRAAGATTAILRAATFALVPVRASGFDLTAVGRSIAMVKAAGVEAFAIVLNAVKPRAPEVVEARELLVDQDLPVVDVTIGDRTAFSRAIATGRTVEESAPRSLAAAEIRALWSYLSERLNA